MMRIAAGAQDAGLQTATTSTAHRHASQTVWYRPAEWRTGQIFVDPAGPAYSPKPLQSPVASTPIQAAIRPRSASANGPPHDDKTQEQQVDGGNDHQLRFRPRTVGIGCEQALSSGDNSAENPGVSMRRERTHEERERGRKQHAADNGHRMPFENPPTPAVTVAGEVHRAQDECERHQPPTNDQALPDGGGELDVVRGSEEGNHEGKSLPGGNMKPYVLCPGK